MYMDGWRFSSKTNSHASDNVPLHEPWYKKEGCITAWHTAAQHTVWITCCQSVGSAMEISFSRFSGNILINYSHRTQKKRLKQKRWWLFTLKNKTKARNNVWQKFSTESSVLSNCICGGTELQVLIYFSYCTFVITMFAKK